ncbi:MAG: hypothetical protein K2Y20_09505 [Sphingomonas sp.]|nr:hypothetical protein [Sphingomonas sp.]
MAAFPTKRRIPRGAAVVAVRPTVLAALLRRRAVAAAAGLDDLEAMLRDQILGSLPTQTGSASGDRPAIRAQCRTPAPSVERKKPVERSGGVGWGWGSATPHAYHPSSPGDTARGRERGLTLFSA